MRISPTTHVGTFKKKFHEEYGVHIKVYRGLSRGHVAEDDVPLHELQSSQIEEREWVLDINQDMTVGEAEDETKKLGFQIQILDGDKLAKNSMRMGDLSGRKPRGGSRPPVPQTPSKEGKKGCLVALLLAPIAAWL